MKDIVMEQLWRDTFNASMDLLKKLKFQGENEVHRYILSLYATILEQSFSALVIRNAGHYAGVEQILRSSLEAMVDLINLLKDHSYLDALHFEYHRQWKNVALAGIEGDNPFLMAFRDNQDAKDLLDRHDTELKALEKRGIGKKRIDQKFSDAGMDDVYASLYNSLCSEGHNDLRALISRHFFEGERGTFEIRVFAEPSEEALAAALDQFVGILLLSGKSVHAEFETEGALETFAELEKRKS